MKLKYLTLGALAIIGAGEIIHRVVQGTAWALSAWGGWDATEATRAAPWLCAAVAAGLAMSLYGMYQDNQQYKRSAKRQKVHQQPQHTVKPANRRKAG